LSLQSMRKVLRKTQLPMETQVPASMNPFEVFGSSGP
jgi:hypothetical protein